MRAAQDTEHVVLLVVLIADHTGGGEGEIDHSAELQMVVMNCEVSAQIGKGHRLVAQ